MSQMMPEDSGTFFDYNDDWRNNLGTFAANELLGLDDFQRVVGNIGDPNITALDRLKSFGTGAYELGGTLSLFVPGANVIGAASKIPLAGKLASKAVPFILPTDKLGKIVEGGSSAAYGGSMMAPEDSFLSQALGAAPLLGAAGLAGLGGYKAFANRRAAKANTAFTVGPDGSVTVPQASRPGTDIVPYVSPTSTPNRWNRMSRKGKFGTVAGLAAVPVIGASFAATRMPGAPAQGYTPTTQPGSLAGRQQEVQQTMLDIIRGSQAAQQDILNQRRREALSGFGETERAALDNYLASLNIMSRGQTRAIRDEYQNLYDRLAGDVAGVQGMGQAGAANVSGRYRTAARRARREGRQENVRSGVGNLTPVSGALADMPANMRAQGADLATYLRNNAAIAARDAGFDAETSLEYGNAVANQLAQDAAFAGAAQEYALERELAGRRADIEAGFTDAETQLALETAQQERDLAAQQAMEQATRVSGAELLATPGINQDIIANWQIIGGVFNGTVPEGTSAAQVQAAQDVINNLYAMYGDVTINSYAQFLADAGYAGTGG